MTIGDFRQLQELELGVAQPNSLYRLLPSITSLELQKIVFPTACSYWGLWIRVDRQLCELVDRLRMMGYRHTLEVELRPTLVGHNRMVYNFTKLLSKFREKGVVTVIDTVRGD